MELKQLRSFMIVFGSAVMILVLTAAFSAANLNRATNLSIELIGLQEVSQASENISAALEEERIAIGQYPLTGDDELLGRISTATETYDTNWALIVNNLGETLPEAIAEIEANRATYKGLLDEVISEYQANPEQNEAANKLRDAINYYLQNLNPKYEDLIDPQLAELARLTELERRNVNRNALVAQTVLYLSVVVGVALVAVVANAVIFSNRLMSSMTTIIDAANAISRGDLDIPIEITLGGEIGDLAEAIERMRTSLKAAIERLRR